MPRIISVSLITPNVVWLLCRKPLHCIVSRMMTIQIQYSNNICIVQYDSSPSPTCKYFCLWWVEFSHTVLRDTDGQFSPQENSELCFCLHSRDFFHIRVSCANFKVGSKVVACLPSSWYIGKTCLSSQPCSTA